MLPTENEAIQKCPITLRTAWNEHVWTSPIGVATLTEQTVVRVFEPGGRCYRVTTVRMVTTTIMTTPTTATNTNMTTISTVVREQSTIKQSEVFRDMTFNSRRSQNHPNAHTYARMRAHTHKHTQSQVLSHKHTHTHTHAYKRARDLTTEAHKYALKNAHPNTQDGQLQEAFVCKLKLELIVRYVVDQINVWHVFYCFWE